MSRVPYSRGFVSSVFGGFSLATAIAAKQFEVLRRPGSGHMLLVAQKLGLVREPDRDALPEIGNASWFSATDGSAIAALGMFGAGLAVGALVFALCAEHRQEDSLYLSVGFICGGMALFLVHHVVGVLVIAVSTTLIVAIRRRSVSRGAGR